MSSICDILGFATTLDNKTQYLSNENDNWNYQNSLKEEVRFHIPVF